MSGTYDPHEDATLAYTQHARTSPAYSGYYNPQPQPVQQYSSPGTYPVTTFRPKGNTRYGIIVTANAVLWAINASIAPVLFGSTLAAALIAFIQGLQGPTNPDPSGGATAILTTLGILSLIALLMILISVVLDIYTVIAAIGDTMRWGRFRHLTGWCAIAVVSSWLLPVLAAGIGWIISHNTEGLEATAVYGWIASMIVIGVICLLRLALLVLGIVRIATAEDIASMPADHPGLGEAVSQGIDVQAIRARATSTQGY